ncbi:MULTISPECIES: pitrilysin family protein [unclassified Clostridium]|uniref:M16 family metallopeptidase n=1 Tax=unclassified Clostridium TaxID=2614128 RepID=UPI0002983238|nr:MULTISPECIES: pitrilysin family protein [unclassified Clostridium]EKQ51240.1 MAG: putative Zn-dependent peptidase [Clostridium sp. Maddingley MBC34-26]
MEEYILENGLKLIYKHTDSELASICISLNAGAGVEKEKFGVAHATEHMVYKGTKNRTEKEINEGLSNLFGFNNAMTNYPYVIYYGTLLKEDLKGGLELLSDIVLNPSFNNDGFKEEMDVIKEELKEWDEDLEQYCEDKLFFNCFNKRRIKHPIIGTKDSLEKMTLSDIKEFYCNYYSPKNTSIAVVSCVKFERVKDIIIELFGEWKNSGENVECNTELANNFDYEEPKNEIFYNKREGIKTCRVEIVCPIDSLSNIEIKSLKLFNQYFGEGVNSMLYDILRTKNGLIYDVITKIAHENYIKLYKITFNTSKENVDKSIALIRECIKKLELAESEFDKKQLEQLMKNFRLKKLFREEQSIVLAKELATYDSMFGDYKIYLGEADELDKVTSEMVFDIGSRVLKKMTIQIIETA